MGCCHQKSSPQIYPNSEPTISFKVGEYDDQGIVEGSMEMYEVKDKELYKEQLHKYIGALHSENDKRPGEICKGTGALISPNIVLTAAHNIWCKEQRCENKNFKFYPGHQGHFKQPHRCEVIFYPPEHLTNYHPRYDYALLKLLEPYKGGNDFIPLVPSLHDLNEAKKKTLAIYGYPAIKYYQFDNYGQLGANQWGLAGSGQVVKVNETEVEIFYKMSTLPGQSGCPIIEIAPDKSLTIIGVHKGSAKTSIDGSQKTVNSGRIITYDFIHILEKKIRKCGGEMFYKSIDDKWNILAIKNFIQIKIQKERGSIQAVKHRYKLSKKGIKSKEITKVMKAILSHQASLNDPDSKLWINFEENEIGSEGCRYLSQAKSQHLIKLQLSTNNIGNEGCKFLSQGRWPQMTFLGLLNNGISSEGCKFLSEANWPHLQQLQLNWNEVDATGCKHLSNAQHWKNSLKILTLYKNKIERAEGVNIFQHLRWEILWQL